MVFMNGLILVLIQDRSFQWIILFFYNYQITKTEMLNDMKKSFIQKHLFNQTTVRNLHLSYLHGNPQSVQQNGSTEIVSNYSNDEDKGSYSQPLKSSQQNPHILQRDMDTDRIIDLKKVNQIQEQEREIERVAQQLITLKQVIKKLKISIGVLVQQQLEDSSVNLYNESISDKYMEFQAPLQRALKKLENMQDRRITPEYREWICQYFNKIFNDIKQIKTQFLNYERAKKKSENILDLSDSKINLGLQKPYKNLIQYQIKCKLLECVLKLCKSKGIFSTTDYIKYSSELQITSNQILMQNLQKYKMNNICQKVKSLKKSGPEQLFYQWKTIHDELQIVNLQEIQRFYKQKKQLSYLNSYENNQNGILIIGGSGVGKTTLFLSMAGQKMIKKKIKSRNCEFENYQAADQQISNQYKTSPFSTSCTRQPAKMQAPKKYTYPQELCLIDTAGFQQSRSGEIDIMNTLYTYETIQEMKKLRIIIVISEKNIGQRDQGLNKFAKNIARYFRDYEQVRQSILFVLTKFDNIKKLKVSCDNILKASLSHKETNEYRFIKHLQESIIYKQCVEFRPTDQSIIFDAQYHIDPVQMDGKLKKLYKSLLKRFPIHHEYENDYINLEYSRQTKDKLIQKKCYLQNMIRKLYKEGNNNFRFYLEQLMFLQNKISKIDKGQKMKYVNQNENTFDILTFIDQINQQVLTKFSSLLEQYFKDCDHQILESILELKNRYSNLFLGNVDSMVESTQVLQEDYHYIFQEITQSINSLKVQFDKIVDEKHKEIGKMMKYKPKSCHDIKNKKWLCAVLNFTKQYFNQPESYSSIEQQKTYKKVKINHKKNKIYEQAQNKEYKALLKTLKKNEQKFKQQFQEQLGIMDQEISNFLIKKSTQTNISTDFLVETQKQIFQTYNNFKKLVFHTQMLQTQDGIQVITIPSDEKVFNSNLQYIISILKQNLDKEFDEICQNIELMNLINHNLKDSDPDISRNVFLLVERYSQKIKMYNSCDKQIYELMQTFNNRVMKKVNLILKQVNEIMFSVTKKQSEQDIKVVDGSSSQFNNLNKITLKRCQKLNSNILYCYLSKINELQQFAQLKKQMEFQVRCFNLKLKDYVINLQRYLQKYDQKLSIYKNLIKKEKKAGRSMISLQIYSSIKAYIEECIEIEHQVKLIHHYFRNQQTKENVFKFEHLGYIKSICYRHSRFLQSEKKSIRQAYQLTDKLQMKQLPLDLIIDYVILEQIYIQKIKFDDSNEFKKLHNAYENSYDNKSQFTNEFQDMKTHELKMLNQCKHRILDKLIEYPSEIDNSYLQKIQSEEFQLTFEPEPIRKTVQIFMYYVQMKQLFEDIDTLNNQQISHDFRVIELSDMSSPIQTIEENISTISNLLITITEIANIKYNQLKEALSQVILDDFVKSQIINYLEGCHILSLLFQKLEKSSLQGLQVLEESLESFKRKNLFNELKQFVDKCESIFYRLSKNIDSIQLEHFQNVSQALQRPQSTKQFLKLLKSQCLFFADSFNNQSFNYLDNETVTGLKDLLKKMEESQNQMDFHWQEEMKELQKSAKDPKNSLHKLIKLYEQHISKVSTQKTLEYRFVQLKKQQLANQIKQFLNDPAQKKIQKGQALCEQLKNYLNFLKSMKFKMVVNLNGIDQIKNIEEMERIYEKQATKSQAPKSQTDMTPSELRENLLSVDYGEGKNQNQLSDRYSVSEVNTSRFGLGIEQKPIQRKSGMKNSRVRQERASQQNQTPKRGVQIDHSFNGIVDDWSKQMAVNTMEMKNSRVQLTKSQSGVQIRNKNLQIASSSPNIACDMTKSGIDHLKRYSINEPVVQPYNYSNMKKSSINLKYAPPVLTYQTTPKQVEQNLVQKNLTDKKPSLVNSNSNQSLNTNVTSFSSRMLSKQKTEAKITY